MNCRPGPQCVVVAAGVDRRQKLEGDERCSVS
jgi:hypothetical protein